MKAVGGDNITNNPNKAEIIKRMKDGLNKRYQNMSEEKRIQIADCFKAEKNGMYGKTHTAEARERISLAKKGCRYKWRKIIINGIEYSSISKAASALRISRTTISCRIKEGIYSYKDN